MSDEQYRTVKKEADLRKVGEATVGRGIKDGEIPAIDIGKGWRIASSELTAFRTRTGGNKEKGPGA